MTIVNHMVAPEEPDRKENIRMQKKKNDRERDGTISVQLVLSLIKAFIKQTSGYLKDNCCIRIIKVSNSL